MTDEVFFTSFFKHSHNTGYVQIKGDLQADGTYDKSVTIGSGVTLLIPYEDGVRNPDTGEAELTTYTAPTTTNLVKLTSGVTLTISQNAVLEIGGQRYAGGANTEAGSTAGNTAVLELENSASIVCSGSINLFGFIDEAKENNSSSVTIDAGASITMPFVIYDFKGGSASTAIYDKGQQSASVFNRFGFVNVVPTLVVNYGGNIYGVANLFAEDNVHSATGHMVGSVETSVLQLTDGSYSKIIAKLDKDSKVSHLQIIGGAKTNGLQLELLGVPVNTANYVFGIGYNFDIILSKADGQSNATFEMGQLFKLLPGAKLTVSEDTTLKLTGKMNIYSEGWEDKWNYAVTDFNTPVEYTSYTTTNAWTGEDLGPAMLIVKGTLDANVLGADHIYLYPGASVTIKTTTWFTTDINNARKLGTNTFKTVTQTLKQLIIYTSDGYTVTLDSNSATFDLSTAYTVNTDGSIKLLSIKNGAGVVGTWYDSKSGGNKVGDAGASYTPTGDITLYPQWSTYTVTYDANGGSVSPTGETVNPGESVTLPTPSRDGYTFNGWYTASDGGTKVGDKGASYTPTGNITLYAQWTKQNVCVTPDTLITLADGTQKEIQYVTDEDIFIVWDFFNEEFAYVPGAVLINHGEGIYTIITLTFDDGTVLKVVGMHGLYSKDLNNWVYIDKDNVDSFVGTTFVKTDGELLSEIKLISYTITEEYTAAYSMFTALHYNCFFENILTLTPSMFEGQNYYIMFEMGEGMKYDEEKMQKDIETYGLYTYEDFAEYVTYEQFIGFNAAYFKVAVGKGYITYEQLIESIYAYVNPSN